MKDLVNKQSEFVGLPIRLRSMDELGMDELGMDEMGMDEMGMARTKVICYFNEDQSE